MALTRAHLKQIADSVGERSGWDFSRVRAERGPVPWDYAGLVRRLLSASDTVLDIGTGGGEVFGGLATAFRRGVGIDISAGMILQAQRNQAARRRANVRWAVMDGHRLGFADAEFDLVLNRHCDVNVSETARVLRPRGHVVTQQVACRNTLNILEAFGWTPASFGEGWWQPVDELAADFARLGCRIVARAEYDVPYWFSDLESLVFWLKAVPLPEPFDVERHWRAVNHLLERHGSPRGIETNEHRELLVVRKG